MIKIGLQFLIMIRTYIFLPACLFLSIVALGQQVSNSFINPGYGFIQNEITLTYSIGDLFCGEVTDETLFLSGLIASNISENPNEITESLKEQILLYPNPCHSTLYVKTELLNTILFQLISINGNIVKTGTLEENHIIDISDIPDGIYIIHLSNLQLLFHFSQKLIKIH